MHAAPVKSETITAVTTATPLPFRDDTMLGVCAGLGEEFGFNPNFLRIAIGSLVLVDIMLAAGIYLGLGVALAVGRLLAPPRRHSATARIAGKRLAQANDSAAVPESLAA